MASTLQNLLKNKAEKDKVEQDKSFISTTDQYQLVPTTTNYPQVVPTPPKQAEVTTLITSDLIPIPTSPTKDFTKVPNSLTTEAIPQGLFKGLSKHTYDVLYKLTRGAINPVRKIQLTRLELMRMTGLSENTQRAHIKYLSVAGLLKILYQTGKHEGAIYEVIVPEEMDNFDPPQVVPSSTNPYQPPLSSTKDYQKLVLDTSQKLVGVGTTQMPVNIEENSGPKTSFKDNKNDDEAFAGFINKFQSASEEMTGRKIQKRDGQNLEKIAELLLLELKIAARRTEGISSMPAFLAEILRRRFFAVQQKTANRANNSFKVKIDTVGKPDSSAYEIKPLDKQGREESLAQLQEFIDDDFLQDFKKWYVEEDWAWLMKQLEKK